MLEWKLEAAQNEIIQLKNDLENSQIAAVSVPQKPVAKIEALPEPAAQVIQEPLPDNQTTQEIIAKENYDATRELYAGINRENYFQINISSKDFDKMATRRLTKVLSQLPSLTFEAVVVAELGSGFGRNWPLL